MRSFIFLLSVLVSMPTLAADATIVENRISFSVSVSTDVPNDTLVATLFSEATGEDLGVLSNKVNTDIHWAADLIKKTPEIRFSTQNYATQPVYRKGERSNLWRVRQTVKLESANAELLSLTLGQVQARLGLNSLVYRVSDSARGAARERLIGEALKKFREQAKQIAANLSASDYKIVRLNIRGGDIVAEPPYPIAEMRMMKASVSPVLEAGEQRVDVTVGAEIELLAQSAKQ